MPELQDLEIAPDSIRSCTNVTLTDCSDIESYFTAHQRQTYISWFNRTQSGRGPWTGVRLVDTPSNEAAFRLFWNRLDQIFGAPINLLQFVSLMSILSNEVRADFTPQTEKMGAPGHPGLAYLFDRIDGLKRSYNTLSGNRTALECFSHPQYIAAHQNRAGASALARTSDIRWKGESWPAGILTTPDPAISGFALEADFAKFRGRGFIQTTGRANYLPLIEFVQRYSGAHSLLASYRQVWKDRPADQIAFESCNADWDALFQQTDLIVAAEALRVHNIRSGGYLALSSDPAVLNSESRGSLFYMGLRIGGGRAYAVRFRDRVSAVLTALTA